jgi:hypothetical protein
MEFVLILQHNSAYVAARKSLTLACGIFGEMTIYAIFTATVHQIKPSNWSVHVIQVNRLAFQ